MASRNKKKRRRRTRPSAYKKRGQTLTALRKEKRAAVRKQHTITKQIAEVTASLETARDDFQRQVGVLSHAELLELRAEGTAVGNEGSTIIVETVDAELARRAQPATIYVRNMIEGEWTQERQRRDAARVEEYAKFYGLPFNPDAEGTWGGISKDTELPLAIDTSLKGSRIRKESDGSSMLMLDHMSRGERMYELPIRILVRDAAGRMFLDYVPCPEPLKRIEQQYLGGAYKAIGTPGNFVALKAKKTQAMVMCCTVAGLTTYGEIPLVDLAIDDLSKEAYAFFYDSFEEDRDPTQLYGGRVTKTKHRQIIDNYLAVCTAAIRNKHRPDRPTDGWLESDAPNRLWPFIRDAVIFEFPEAAYKTLHQTYRDHFERRARAVAEKGTSEQDVEELRVKLQTDGAASSPWPAHLPFPSTYLAYGRGMPIETIPDTRPIGYTTGTYDSLLLAHLILADGDVIAFIGMAPAGYDLDTALPEQLVIAPIYQRRNGVWLFKDAVEPFVVPTLIEYINDHKTFVEEGKRGLSHETLVKRTAKRMKITPPIPPPFYVVYLQDKFVKDRTRQRQKLARKIEWQHRWHTRGSWNIRFKRGPLPLGEKAEKSLRKRKYKVFTITKPDGELAAELAKRGIPPKAPGEWLAVLKYWRGPHIKGPADKPLVESVRRSTKDWKEPST
jgi:hypothetical protein